VIDFKLDPRRQCLRRASQQWMPDQLTVGRSSERRARPAARVGCNVQPSPYPLGAVQLIARDPASGAWLGATDPRRDGAALGY
jgi:gamma-glutamyltranspeptidase/glutathione hydrolase